MSRKDELEWEAIEGALRSVIERATRLMSSLPPALLIIDQRRWDPSPAGHAFDRPSSPRQRVAGEVDDNDGISRPAESAALRVLEDRDRDDSSYRQVAEAARRVLIAEAALNQAEGWLTAFGERAAKADEPRLADVCIRCHKPGAGRDAGYCHDCHDEWEAAGFPDHDRFTRAKNGY